MRGKREEKRNDNSVTEAYYYQEFFLFRLKNCYSNIDDNILRISGNLLKIETTDDFFPYLMQC